MYSIKDKWHEKYQHPNKIVDNEDSTAILLFEHPPNKP